MFKRKIAILKLNHKLQRVETRPDVIFRFFWNWKPITYFVLNVQTKTSEYKSYICQFEEYSFLRLNSIGN
jgi:hypothetical protein